jgi:hypothetical protein
MKSMQLFIFTLFLMASANVSYANQGDETKSGGDAPEQECDHVSTMSYIWYPG